MIGLVLEGGGARGSYQIGAYKALKEEAYDFQGVCGTSIGALNGALIAQGDEEKAYDLWANLQPSELFGIPIKSWNLLSGKDLQLNDLPELLKVVQNLLHQKGLDIQKVKDLLHQIIHEETLRKSPMDFGFITYSLTDRKALEYFKENVPEGKMVDYILASANLPIFHLEKTEGKVLLDGGVYDNLPIQLLTKKGYTKLVIIRTLALGVVRKFDKKDLDILCIEPSDDLGNILDFNPEQAKLNLQLGFFDVKKTLHQLKGSKYYIEPKKEELHYVDLIKNLSNENLDEIAQTMGLQDISPMRFLFEHLMPRVAEALNLHQNSTYEDIVIGVAEWMAEKLGIERFKIYSVNDFLNEIRQHPKAEKVFQKPKTSQLLQIKNELISLLFRETILKEISWFIIHRTNHANQ